MGKLNNRTTADRTSPQPLCHDPCGSGCACTCVGGVCTVIELVVHVSARARLTPAMAAGVTDRLWEMADIVNMLEAWEARNARSEAA
jgi:hypothetical protein